MPKHPSHFHPPQTQSKHKVFLCVCVQVLTGRTMSTIWSSGVICHMIRLPGKLKTWMYQSLMSIRHNTGTTGDITAHTCILTCAHTYTSAHTTFLSVAADPRELMMGEEGKPGKKIRLRGRGKRPDRPPENPVIDVSFFLLKIQLGKNTIFCYFRNTNMSILVFNLSSFHWLKHHWSFL